jgi:hypothetical protein
MFTLDVLLNYTSMIELSILRGRIGKYTMVGTEIDRRLEKQNAKGSDAV